jgi:hypothetical protein
MTTTLTESFIDPEERDDLPRCWSGPARGYEASFQFGKDVRPWNWIELTAEDADKVFTLLTRFVEYFNTRYGERPQHRIPPCWAEHGALTEELTTLFFARWQAFESQHASVGGAEYWHAYTLPAFLERMKLWLGSGLLTCQTGTHRDDGGYPTKNVPAWELRNEVVASLDFVHRRGFERPDNGTPHRPSLRVEFLERQEKSE